MTKPSLILASSSPRRREILEAMGLVFTVRTVAVDESSRQEEPAADMVVRLAAAKATSIALDAGQIIIGADTAVVLGDEVFGKPADADDALRMLSGLSGQTHQVMTGVAVVGSKGLKTVLSVTDVRFRNISVDEARCYWKSGEPRDKAGAYAIQGRGGVFVEAIMGSYTGVVGLPVFETACLLRDAGLETLPTELPKPLSGA
jgi:septum formation protein